jgi:RNA polymerase sigma-70 factor (ECF subfamily)
MGEVPEHMEDPPDPRADSESRLVTEERRRRVRKILEEMPERDRCILRSLFLEERDKDGVCRQMNVDRDYLRVLLHRAKLKFREGFLRGKAAMAFLSL